jgi:transposase InsO family protein
MSMAYTTNPHLPQLRMEAVKMVRQGMSIRAVARHFNYSHCTVRQWLAHAAHLPVTARSIPTRSSRPHHHPHELSEAMQATILAYRLKYRRCAEVLQHLMAQDGYTVSLSSVKRTLKRVGWVYPSPWKKWHQYPPRPLPESPGILVEVDTIHDGVPENRLYVYTLLDVCSRWAFAWAAKRISTHASLTFVRSALHHTPFQVGTLQSDHGPEFSKWFTKQIIALGMTHRHSRVRTPNDNAHLERFNRTIQDECLRRLPRNLKAWNRGIPEYLDWYNTQRPHMGLEMKTPSQVVTSY